MKSKGFYFSSPDLKEDALKNINNNWDGESTYFTIQNSLNDSLITDYDIKYKVTCTISGDAASYSACKVNGTDSNVFEGILSSYSHCINTKDDTDVSLYNQETCEVSGYNWIKQMATKDLYFDIVKTGDKEIIGLTANIEVTTLSPYAKTLKGEYVINKGKNEIGSLSMEYKTYSNYDRLVISNSYKENKCAKLSWNPDNLRIDVDNNIRSYGTDSNGYINEIIFNIASKNNISYIFYKTDKNKSYSISDFTLVESEC